MSSGLSPARKNSDFILVPFTVNKPTVSTQLLENRWASRANLVHMPQSLS